jgi:TatD DNase family protein
MELIDAHCHLQMDQFSKDRDEVLRRAISSGVTEIVVSGFDSISNYRALELDSKKGIHITLGLSPNVRGRENIDFIKSQIAENAERIVAIGEVGIDRVKSRMPLEKQREIFKEFLSLAEDLDKPVVIHAREAEIDAIQILKNFSVKCVFHCFNGNPKALRMIQDLGHLVSISTMISFSDRVRKIAKEVEIENLLIETDSPFLSPKKGRNEPANLVYALNEISRQKDLDKEELSLILVRNTRKFYRI